jgi:hypothetical protein
MKGGNERTFRVDKRHWRAFLESDVAEVQDGCQYREYVVLRNRTQTQQVHGSLDVTNHHATFIRDHF